MMKSILLFVLCILPLLSAPGFAQEGEWCELTVTAPQAGDVWVVDQRYSLLWTSGELCPSTFTKVELIGRPNNMVDKVLNSRSNVANTGWMVFTPTQEMLGYAAYVFRFWGVAGPQGGEATILGVSEVFLIAENDLPPLIVDPAQLTFLLPAGTGPQSETLRLIANQDRVDWTVESSDPWLTVQPAQGTLSRESGAAQVAVSADAAGLATGRHSGELTFTVPSRVESTVKVVVDLIVLPPEGGSPRLAVEPRRLVFTHLLDESYTPRRITLSNPGDGGTEWRVDPGADWLTISPASGYLGPGGSADLVVLVTRAFDTPGSHRAFARFRGRSPAAVSFPVVVNLTAAAASGAWPPPGKSRVTLPVASHTPGAEDSFWLTDATAIITDGTAQAAQARYKLQALQTLPGAASLLGAPRFEALTAALEEQAHSASAPPRGTNQFIWGALGTPKARGTEAVVTETPLPDDRPTLFLDIMGHYFGLTDAFGFLQMAGDRARDVLLISRTYTTEAHEAPGRGGEETEWTYGQSVQSPTEREIIGTEGGTAYVPGLRYEAASGTSKGWRSNLFVTEIGGAATTVSVQLYDVHGAAVGTMKTQTLEPFTQWALINTALTFGTTLPWTYAAVTSAGGGRIVVLGSVVDSNSNDPTTISGIVASPGYRAEQDLVLPAAVHTPGNYGTTWRSDVILLNASDASLTVTAQFIPMAGAASGVMDASITLEPRGMAVYADIVSTLFSLDPGIGTLRLLQVDPGAFFAFNRIYNVDDNGFTYGQGTGAYAGADAAGLGDGTLYTVGLERSSQYRTNVGVVETAGAPATVLFTIVSPDGESRGYLARLAARQWMQAEDIIREKAGFTGDLANVWVMINVVEGAGRVIGYGSIVDNYSGDATYIKLEKR